MRLSRLIQEIETIAPVGAVDPEIRTLVHDSRKVVAGSAFVCVAGGKFDGHLFAQRAVEMGAAAVIAERPLELPVPVVVVPSTRRALARLALRMQGDPQERLRMVGITGTNGKTTVSFLVRAILREAGERVGMLGTVGSWVDDERIDDLGLTTPDPLDLAASLRRMADAGCTTVVMEVSSHALDQERVAGLTYAAAAFTNLSRDHLDYHPDMEAYFAAKARLFSERLGGVAVVNADDPCGHRIPAERILRFSRKDPDAEIFAPDARIGLEGIEISVRTPAGTLAIRSPLVGDHNAENLLCAAGLAIALGVPNEAIERGLAASTGAPGRLERIEGKGVTAFVDYAHTDAALRVAIAALRRANPRRLTVVFGCGGDRDRGKRAPMGEAAAEADRVVVTSDNPRTEDPAAIAEAILVGLRNKNHPDVTVELDRRKAIELALTTAVPGEVVLIAGKGHEDYQIVGTEKRHFDDREEARRVLGGSVE